MKPYFDLKKFPKDEKIEAETIEIEKQNIFKECPCIPRAIRETAIDQKILELVQQSGKTEVTLLSVGSGDLGQEYHINKLLTENGIHVQWLLVDKNYDTDESWELLKTLKKSIEDSGSSILGAYTDISAYAAFKLGKTEFCRLTKENDFENLFTKKWIDLFSNHALNDLIFERSYRDFKSNPLPTVDFVLAIDLNPTGISGYEKTKQLTNLTLDATVYLNPEATAFSVINMNALGARSVDDLEIETIEPYKKQTIHFG